MDQQQVGTKYCPACGKQVTAGGGSLTSWIFGRTSCKCQTPRLNDDRTPNPRASLANRLHGGKEKKELSFGEGYEVIDLIGEGGMASVYKVKSKADGTHFAIKMLKPELAKEPGAVLRFKQEVKAASKLTHANLVATYELGETTEGNPFFVMDYVDGNNLSSLLVQEGRLQPSRALEIFISLCEAIAHAHSKGVVHRDIKPSNVLVTTEGFVKVVDFGIAKVLITATTGNTASLTQTGEVFGSPLYMSPEQCMGETSDERSDIYSLGCVMYELLSGNPPFQGANPIKIIFGHLNEKPARLARTTGGDNEKQVTALEAIVMCCLEKRAADRYQTVEQLLDDLSNVKEGRPPNIARYSPKKRRDVIKKIAIFIGVIGMAAGGYFASTSLVSPEKEAAKPPATRESSAAEKKMIASFTNEINAHPDEDYWYIMRGTTYREAGQLNDALMDFTMAVNKNPKNAKAYRERGWTHALMGKWKEAAEDNSIAIELNPKYADAYIGRSRDYAELGEFDKAVEDATRAIELNPKNHMAFLNRAGALYALKRLKEAMVDCDATIKLHPDDPHPRILRARIAEQLGDYKKGIDDLSFYLTKDRDNVPRMIERAYMYNLATEYDLALKDAEKAKQLDPKHIGAYIAKAEALNGLGRTDEAFAEFERGLKVDPNCCEIFKRRGDIYVKLGRIPDARQQYDAALKLWPAYPEAIKAKQAIGG